MIIWGAFSSFVLMLAILIIDNSSTLSSLNAGTFHSDCKDLLTPLISEYLLEYFFFAIVASFIVLVIGVALFVIFILAKKEKWILKLVFFVLGFVLSFIIYVPLFATYIVKTDQITHKATFDYCTREYWQLNI